MSPEPSPRQVLYALVSAGFLIVVAVLVVGGAAAGLVPFWWTASMAIVVVGAGIWTGLQWRRTGIALGLSIGLFLIWTVGTLILA